jgi:hypothetical protein
MWSRETGDKIAGPTGGDVKLRTERETGGSAEALAPPPVRSVGASEQDSAAGVEKALQHLCRFGSQHSFDDFQPMIQQRRIRDLKLATHASEAQIARAEDERSDAGCYKSPGAHGAGLECAIKGRGAQAIVSDRERRLSNGKHFGVRGWIEQIDGRVTPLTDDLALCDDDAPDRDFAGIFGLARQYEGAPHPAVMVFRHLR